MFQISSGKKIFNSSTIKQNRYSIVFEKPFSNIPTVNVCPIKTNQNVVAVNVTRTGFDIILSLDWCNEPIDSFEIHYKAYLEG